MAGNSNRYKPQLLRKEDLLNRYCSFIPAGSIHKLKTQCTKDGRQRSFEWWIMHIIDFRETLVQRLLTHAENNIENGVEFVNIHRK